MKLPTFQGVPAIFNATVWAIYEVAFLLLPVFIWLLVLLSLNMWSNDAGITVAAAFGGVSVYAAMLRDGVSAFNRGTVKDNASRGVLLVAGLIGVVLSAVLLSLAILGSNGVLTTLQHAFYVAVWSVLGFGIVLYIVVKSTLLQRGVFKRDV